MRPFHSSTEEKTCKVGRPYRVSDNVQGRDGKVMVWGSDGGQK